MATERRQVLPQIVSVKEVGDPGQQMVERHMIIKVEGVKAAFLNATLVIRLPPSLRAHRHRRPVQRVNYAMRIAKVIR
ncbi:hypothetical protein BZM27_51120 [Paraburkholderia steynii]|uniref:Uncharacterized protein n=1 Tax=Paraburkholderia steynii TaxID=1245441 RepID=A0A4R0X330_9BURK|nr:hypothetical protein BZM27_51120 [Paraburkholderia steynii]